MKISSPPGWLENLGRKKLNQFFWSIFFMVVSLNSIISGEISSPIVSPEKYFGFKLGTDCQLIDYQELISYLKKLDEGSPRLQMVEIGRSPLGRPMYLVFISSEENISQLEKLREINRKLALEPNLSETERNLLINQGKVFLLATLSMHADEVGPSQAVPLIAYELVSADDFLIKTWLNNVVFMMVPNANPDGMDMQVHHYRKYKGTKYEGCSLPGLYHKYVGHDNNRDYVNLTQSDTKAVARIYNLDWFPQVLVDKHQMDTNGPRYFVPPVHDPIAENIEANLWNWTKVFGSAMITDMTEVGLAGVCHSYVFDDYWPGSTQTSQWKGVISLLTELASAKQATPVYIEPNELQVVGKGLAEYKISINMPLPWPGGWWRLSDLLQYEIVSIKSLLKTASLYRQEILAFRHDLCRKEVRRGQKEPPFYYVLPLKQPDQSELVGLVNLLKEHGVRVYRLTQNIRVGEIVLEAGDIVIPLAQPYRSFIKEVMEKQEYPVRHYTPEGELIKPYDITSWSLPLHRGLKSFELNLRSEDMEKNLAEIMDEFSLRETLLSHFQAAILVANNNESYMAAFWALKQGLKVFRLDEETIISGKKVPKGSFFFPYDPKLGSLLQKLTVSPQFVSEPKTFKTHALRLPRIALVETYFHDMDAGWTRYVFDTYSIPFTVIRPGDFEKTDLIKNFDIVIFPDSEKSILMEGKYQEKGETILPDYPPEFTKGIGPKGMERLMMFLDAGGIIISWGASTSLFLGKLEIPRPKISTINKEEKAKVEKKEEKKEEGMRLEEGGKEKAEEKTKEESKEKEEFQLPVKDEAEALQKAGLYCPASLLRIILTPDHPLTLGLPLEIGILFTGRPIFQTSIPLFDMDRRVIGRFPEKEILLSGYAEKIEKLGNKVNLVWLKKGKGQLVLFAFSPIFRASTQATYKLLFNALLLSKIS
ncbi:MAG: M14 family metallopeptidase [Candidatus Aminicenantes bacterium]|nr:M14 family metallopeptidase [Candidatus Aminicenantes bacterium]